MKKGEPSKLLLACYGGGHVNVVIPVYKRLKSLGYDVKIFAFTLAQEKLEKLGIEYLSYRSLSFLLENEREVLSLGKSLVENLSSGSTINIEESYAYMGVGYINLVQSHGEKKAAELYSEFGRKSFLPVPFMELVLDYLKPNVVFSTNSPRSEHALFIAAKNKSIKSICLIDFYDKIAAKTRFAEITYSNKILVGFEYVRSELLDFGWSDSRVVLAGNPAFDQMYDPNLLKNSIAMKKKLNIENKKVVLFAQNFFDVTKKAEDETRESLISLCNKNSNYQLIIRPHPNDKYFNSEEGCGYLVCGQETPLYEVLAMSDVVVYENSTVGLEASLIGKKAVQMDFIDHPDKFSAELLEIGIGAKSLDSLISHVDRILRNSTGEVKVVYKNPVPSTDKVVNEITSLISEEC